MKLCTVPCTQEAPRKQALELAGAIQLVAKGQQEHLRQAALSMIRRWLQGNGHHVHLELVLVTLERSLDFSMWL